MSVQRGFNCRAGGDYIWVRSGSGAMGSAIRSIRSRYCRLRTDINGIFREEADVGDGREQQFSRGILLGNTVVSGVDLTCIVHRFSSIMQEDAVQITVKERKEKPPNP